MSYLDTFDTRGVILVTLHVFHMRFDLSRPLFPQTSADPPTDHVRAGDDDIYVILPAVTDGPSSPLVLAIFGRFFNVYNLVCMEIQETNHLRL